MIATTGIMVPKPIRLYAYRAYHIDNAHFVYHASTDGAGTFNYQQLDFSAYRFRRLAAACYCVENSGGGSLEINVYHGAVSGTPVLSVTMSGSSIGLLSDEDTGEAICEANGQLAIEFKTVDYTGPVVAWHWVWAEVDVEPVV